MSEMWLRYVDHLSKEYQILLFDYPQELKTNQELVRGMHAFFEQLNIHKPVLIGASDGGMVAQIYTQKYPNDVGGLVLISTGGMDEKTLKSLRRKYFFAPVMLWYMKHCNYEKLKPRLIKVFTNYAKGESEEDQIHASEMGKTIFKDYRKEKDIRISSLLVDLMNQTPVTNGTFAHLKCHIMLILPDKDFFSEEMQKDLVSLMHDPKIIYISVGHLSTALKADAYVKEIREFLRKFYKEYV